MVSASPSVCLPVYDLRVWHRANKTPTENYLQLSPDDPLRPGALGLGQARAVLIIYIWFVYSYSTPLARGLLADC